MESESDDDGVLSAGDLAARVARLEVARRSDLVRLGKLETIVARMVYEIRGSYGRGTTSKAVKEISVPLAEMQRKLLDATRFE